MKTYIYFVRHGEVHNPKKIWYGRLPFYHLSQKGNSQVEKTAEYLSDKHIDVIYSSPLLRARQSAEILKSILKLDKIHSSKKILEVRSSLEGKPQTYLETIKYNIFGFGETIEELSERMQQFITQIVKLHPGKHIAVVSHGDPIMVVKAETNRLPIINESIRPGKSGYIKSGEIYLLKI